MAHTDIPDFVERRIVERVVKDLLKAGYQISVDDGGCVTLKRSRDRGAILAALATTDEDTLYVHKPDAAPGERANSFVLLIYGNGEDIISDYGVSLEEVLSGANALADKLGSR